MYEAVKGLRGFWHYTDGTWTRPSKLVTLCGKRISPNYRRVIETEANKVVS